VMPSIEEVNSAKAYEVPGNRAYRLRGPKGRVNAAAKEHPLKYAMRTVRIAEGRVLGGLVRDLNTGAKIRQSSEWQVIRELRRSNRVTLAKTNGPRKETGEPQIC